jgi:hypothetical protein
MRIRALVGTVAVAITATAITAGSAYAGTLDQSQPSFDPDRAYMLGPSEELAQTVVSGVSGDLDRVDLSAFIYDSRTAEPLTVEIRTTADGPYAYQPGPSDQVLASTTVPVDGVGQWGTHNPLTLTTAQFEHPAHVRKGESYAIVLSDPARDPSNYSNGWFVTYDATDPYPDGLFWGTQFGRSIWAPVREYMDIAFRTYVSDADPPDVTVSHTATGADGWNNGTVSLTINAADTGSGLAGPPACTDDGNEMAVSGATSPYTATVTGHRTHAITCSATDNRGNVGTAEDTVKIDTLPPRVYIDGPVDGQVFTADWTSVVPGIGCRTEDDASGVATNAQADPDYVGGYGAAFAASYGYGTFTSTCKGADDLAGNTGAEPTVHFSVVYPWEGFFTPVDNTTPDGRYVLNKAQAGSTIPVKFSLGAGHGLDILAAGSPSSAPITCDSTAPVDQIEQYTTTSVNGLRYEQGANRYTYNWETDRSWAGSCRQLIVRLNDGSRHAARFMFPK